MFHRIVALTIAVVFSFSMIAAAQADIEAPVLQKLAAAEQAVYGQVQPGPLIDRISKVEKDFYGQETNRTILEKVDFLYDTLFVQSDGEPAALMQMNAVEWALTHAVAAGGALKDRIGNMEMALAGNHRVGAFQERLAYLAGLSYPGGSITIGEQTVPADTLVKIKMITPVNSKTANTGDIVNYQVAEDLVIDGMLVLAKGSVGAGTITKVSRSHNFGRDAQVEIDFSSVSAVDGAQIATFLGEKAQKETESMAIAAGATLAGLVVLGPVGIVTGAFVKGKEVNIPEGTEMYVQTKAESSVWGIAAQ